MKHTIKLVLGTFVCCALLGASHAKTDSFKVNGELITKAEQDTLIEALVQRGAQKNEQLEARVKYLLIRDAVLAQKAKKMKLDRNREVKRSFEKAKQAILVKAAIGDWVKKNPVSDADVRAFYEREKQRWGTTEVEVRHILLKDEELAKKLLDRIKAGEKFEQLAKEYSIDTEQNKNAGGLIPWTSPVVFDKDFSECFSKLKVGELAKQPVKTRLGWHIVKLEGRRSAERWANYEANKPALTQLLTQQRVQTYIDKVVKEAKVQPIAGQ